MIKTTTKNLKSFYFLLSSGLLLVSGSHAFARQVPQADAKTVAENFFHQKSAANSSVGELTYTSLDANGKPLFYAFNMNNNSGFVLVSAEDAAQPIIGYSIEQGFQKPATASPAAYWLGKRESEIKYLRDNNITTNTAIFAKWNQYLTTQTANKNSSASAVVVAPLLSTKWNQSPFFNDSCPGGSVTGCVATTMSQIMRYWSYPAHGTGTSSYCDCSASGFTSNYGTLKANYNVNYNWNNMPLTLNTHNSEIAKLMYHAGVSVHMDYSPSESGAQVLATDGPYSAQNAYITYFSYDPNIILGAHRSSYADGPWLTMLKNDLDIGRPIQYAGFGPQGGHTWVCDGYDDSNMFHMNWGWGGQSDGYYNVNALNPSGDNFSQGEEALMGIVPMATNGADAGVVSISPVTGGCTNNQYSPNVKIRNYGNSTLTSCIINFKLDNGTFQSFQWVGSLVTGQSADINIANYTALPNGTHSVTCYVSNPNTVADVNTLNDQSVYSFNVYGADILPMVEGFEVPSQTNTHWSVMPSNGSDWSFTSQAFSGGAKSMMIDNLANTTGNTSILQGMNSYDFSGTQDPYFHFKVAYQQKATSNNDKLRLELSNDCGATWWLKWSKQGTALATTTVLSNSVFMPFPADFVQYDIPGTLGSSVLFRWVFISDATAPGNNVYLDDINLRDEATVGIKENSSAISGAFEVYPNPGNGETFLKFKLDNASSLEINVTDISGRKMIDVAKADYSAGDQIISINKEKTLARGIYMVTISENGVKSTRKLVIN